MDVATLQDDELAALEKYVENGGGVAWFVGSQTNRDFYNDRLYRDGEGLFPGAADAADAIARQPARHDARRGRHRPPAVSRAGRPAQRLPAAGDGRLLLRGRRRLVAANRRLA